MLGLTDFAGFAGGVGAGTGVGLVVFTPGLTTESNAAFRADIAKSISIFPAEPAAFFALAVAAAATAAFT